jgi:plastocyanin
MSHRFVAALFLFAATSAVAEPLSGTISDAALRRKIDVVYIEKVEGTFPAPAKQPVINQKGNTFVPHVSTVVVGTRVSFQSMDPELHNVFARAGKAVMFNDAVLPSGRFERTFNKPGVVHLTCNIHKEMSAYVLVVQNPFFTTIDRATGSFHIDNLPPGNYTLRVWGEALSDEQNARTWQVTVDKNATAANIASL